MGFDPHHYLLQMITNDNFADIDLSTAEINNLITALQLAKAHHEQVTIRLSNADYQKDVES